MKTLVVCVSVLHGNRRRLLPRWPTSSTQQWSILTPSLSPRSVGFGSGIFATVFHPRLRDFIRQLPSAKRTKAFLFATSGGPEFPFWPYMRPMAELLEIKGFDVVGTFRCRGSTRGYQSSSSAASTKDTPMRPTWMPQGRSR